jgi:hypothetical protein
MPPQFPPMLRTNCRQTSLGVMFAAYNVRADRLTVLKTSYPEELMLTSRARSGTPRVISAVAFRCACGNHQHCLHLQHRIFLTP